MAKTAFHPKIGYSSISFLKSLIGRASIIMTCVLLNCCSIQQATAQLSQSPSINAPAPLTMYPYTPVSSAGRPPTSHSFPSNSQTNQPQQLQRQGQPVGRTEQAFAIRQMVQAENRNPAYERYQQYRADENRYRNSFYRLMEMMSARNFSLSQAVFIVENTFLHYHLSYDSFQKKIQEKAALCRKIMETEQLDTSDNMAKNYAIQKLFTEGTRTYDTSTKTFAPVTPICYDFEDFFGEKDWTKMFVSKLFRDGTGQCHSMPLLYLLIAHELHATAWLSISPEHSFIKFMGPDSNVYNFEATRGAVTSDQSVIQFGHINPTAIKNKIYLDTLRRMQLLSAMMVDLAQGYLETVKRYDDLASQIINAAYRYDTNSIRALMLKANLAHARLEQEASKFNWPPADSLPKYKDLYSLYQQRNSLYEKMDDMGYQDMPKEAYQTFLESLEQYKHKEEGKALQEKVKRMAKLPKSTLINKKD